MVQCVLFKTHVPTIISAYFSFVFFPDDDDGVEFGFACKYFPVMMLLLSTSDLNSIHTRIHKRTTERRIQINAPAAPSIGSVMPAKQKSKTAPANGSAEATYDSPQKGADTDGLMAAITTLQQENSALRTEIDASSVLQPPSAKSPMANGGEPQAIRAEDREELDAVLELLQEAEGEADHWRRKYEALAASGPQSSSPPAKGTEMQRPLEVDDAQVRFLLRQLAAAASLAQDRALVLEFGAVLGHEAADLVDVAPPLAVASLSPKRDASASQQQHVAVADGDLVRVVAALEERARSATRSAAALGSRHLEAASARALTTRYFKGWSRHVARRHEQRTVAARNREFLGETLQDRHRHALRLRRFHVWAGFARQRVYTRRVETMMARVSSVAVALGGHMKDQLASCEELALDVDAVLSEQSGLWEELRSRKTSAHQ